MDMNDKPKVCVLGMGFVGLTLAVVMAECGHEVIGVEANPAVVAKLVSGEAHFYEVGLETRLRRVLKSGSLRISSDVRQCGECNCFIITVGTPLDGAGTPRMDMVERAAGEVASVMPDGAMVILRSTVRLGTTRKVVLPLLGRTGRTFGLAYCPERTIEGNALAELRSLPQICGGLTRDDAWRAATLFQSITFTTIRVSSLEAAELVKLLDNSYRDLFFAFGNEVALLCEAAGLDAGEIIGAGKLGYARTNVALPGLVGGPCLEKDPHILAHSLRDFDHVPQLISTGRRINETLPGYIARRVAPLLASAPANMRIAVCGMAFKGRPETDDLRGTPSMLVLRELQRAFPDATIVVQDFACTHEHLREFFGVEPVSIEDAFDGSHLVVIANNNRRYEGLDADRLLSTMADGGVLYDCWSVLPAQGSSASGRVRCFTLGTLSRSESTA